MSGNLNRRQFLSTTAMTASGIIMNALESYAQPLFKSKAPGFAPIVMATNWGFTGNFDAFGAKAKEAGYDGVEVWLPGDEKSRSEFLQAMQKHNLKFAFLYGGGDRNPEKHLTQFQEGVKAALSMKPLYLNCHSGKDYFSFDQNKKFIEWTYSFGKDSGVPIYHETHRGRILYSSPIARNYLEAIKDLRLTLDISHWCAVHESLLGDQDENVNAALSKTEHIHIRVGHPEGPQVNDPRAPEWESAVKAHFAWWDKIVERKRTEGKPLTFLTEFGPIDYMPALPYTRQPVANQWEINSYMKNVVRKRYSS
jgi:sugar phosphate isomerase/epimerase